jgi:hypothetical protein
MQRRADTLRVFDSQAKLCTLEDREVPDKYSE